MLGTELASVSEEGGGALDYDLIYECECPPPKQVDLKLLLHYAKGVLSPNHSSIALIINHNTWVAGGTHHRLI